jgi:F1F0 ATPase subunit 2
MTGDTLHLIAAFAAGIGLGAVYLGALWITVRRLARLKHGGFWLLGSTWLRIGLLLAAWYWISDGRWERLLACLLGFFAIRFATTRWAASVGAKRPAGS